MFAEDEEQVDKLLALADRVPTLQHIVYSDPRGMRKYDDPRLMEADKLRRAGPRPRRARARPLRQAGRRHQGRGRRDPLHHLGHHGESEAGDARRPAACSRHCATYLSFDPKGPDDEYVSVLPLPWIMEQVYALGKGLLCRMKINFVEAARHHDERFPRDRADLRAVCAAGLGIDRRRCARRRDGFVPAQAKASTTSA